MLTLIPEDSNNLLVDMGIHTFTILNLYPYNNGHLMIVPKRHTSDFAGLSSDELSESFEKLQLAEKALSKALNPHGFNIGANIGRVAGAGIEDHIHFHIVPRWNGDSNFMPIIGDVKVISQDLAETKSNLLVAYSELNS
jgi:ATP adenylyltransferase